MSRPKQFDVEVSFRLDDVNARRGRPPISIERSQLPACTVPTSVHDAAIREALQRGVSVAQVVRDALFSHLKYSAQAQTSAQ